MSDETKMVPAAWLAEMEYAKLEEDVARRREAIMATLLTGWLSDMEGAAAKRNVAHARKTADAIMEAAR